MRMFESVNLKSNETISQVMDKYKNDSRDNKLNLCIGVYQAEGSDGYDLPVVLEASKEILAKNTKHKELMTILGSEAYRSSIKKLIFPTMFENEYSISVIQTLGASGAIYLALKILQTYNKTKTVWLSQPGWDNHIEIALATGVSPKFYSYGESNLSFNVTKIVDDLSDAVPGDILIVQGCCHNPTGLDPTTSEWKFIAKFAAEKKLNVIIDHAYFGLAKGLVDDQGVIETFLKYCPHIFVASSFSKSLALFSERVGALSFITKKAEDVIKFEQLIRREIRSSYSMPPSYGSNIVTTVINNPELYKQWQEDLDSIRVTLSNRKDQLVQSLKDKGLINVIINKEGNGMFVLLDITPLQVSTLIDKYGIYVLNSGRLSLASLQSVDIPRVTSALSQVCE